METQFFGRVVFKTSYFKNFAEKMKKKKFSPIPHFCLYLADLFSHISNHQKEKAFLSGKKPKSFGYLIPNEIVLKSPDKAKKRIVNNTVLKVVRTGLFYVFLSAISCFKLETHWL